MHRILAIAIAATIPLACSSDGSNSWPDASAESKLVYRVDTLRRRTGEPVALSSFAGVQLRNGGFAIPDEYLKRVDVFDSNSILVDSMGRVGSGPGEFRDPRLIMSLPGDSILVHDPVLQRVRVYDSAHRIVSDVSVAEWGVRQGYQTQLVGRFRDGRLVGIRQPINARRSTELRESVDTTAVIAGLPIERPAEIVRLTPLRAVTFGAGFARFKVSLSEVAPVLAAVCDDGIVTVDSSGRKEFDANGRLRSSVALAFARRPLSTRDRADVLERAVRDAGSKEQRARATRILQSQLREITRAFAVPQLDAAGHLWFGVPGKGGVVARVDPRAQVEFTSAIPRGGFPLQLTRDRLPAMLIGNDSSDPVVAVYRLAADPKVDMRPLGWCGQAVRLQ